MASSWLVMIRLAAILVVAGSALWATTTIEAEEYSQACDLWLNGRNICTISIPMVASDH